jgi:hypothetical protein
MPTLPTIEDNHEKSYMRIPQEIRAFNLACILLARIAAMARRHRCLALFNLARGIKLF